nr:hypothetical protein CFP56_00295 [Quercus suber]
MALAFHAALVINGCHGPFLTDLSKVLNMGFITLGISIEQKHAKSSQQPVPPAFSSSTREIHRITSTRIDHRFPPTPKPRHVTMIQKMGCQKKSLHRKHKRVINRHIESIQLIFLPKIIRLLAGLPNRYLRQKRKRRIQELSQKTYLMPQVLWTVYPLTPVHEVRCGSKVSGPHYRGTLSSRVACLGMNVSRG